VLFIGTNPYEAHGIPNARDTLRHLHQDPRRTMVVIDPRRTATAKLADVHLQLRPGTDAHLMAAILATIVREGLHDAAFLQRRCSGFEAVEAALRDVPVDDFIRHADVPAADVLRVARAFARAPRACVRIDLGIQQSLNSTLNSYLEKLLFLVTGNFGIAGGNNLHSAFIPVIGHSDEGDPRPPRSARLGMFPIAGIFPPSILAREIDNENEDRVRALFVDSGNPALTIADTPAIEAALARLELLVVVDVAMTETARHAHYVLPASSQYEKFEATGFNFEFPTNYFHLRRPVFAPLGDSLPEAEIYTRLLERMGAIPPRFPALEWLARHEPAATRHLATIAGLALRFATRPALAPFGASILYRTLGKALGRDAGAVTVLALAMAYAARHPAAVARAGVKGNRLTRGANLFRRILDSPQGTVISEHRQDDVWSFVRTADGLVHLEIPELLAQLRALEAGGGAPDAAFPLVLMAGERRSYNANQIFRDPAWRKTDADGAMRIHPSDALKYEVADGSRAICRSRRGAIEVTVAVDDAIRPGLVSLPHGYGMRYRGGAPQGPELNRLTALEDCDPLTYTPHHKFVPVTLEPAA
jgi:anaerobic selenocysteine-containing dehydrogenase